MKVVINRCFGGFALSDTAREQLGADVTDRSNPRLVRVVEELGDAASGGGARLEVVELPDGVEWRVIDYDGKESVVQGDLNG